VNEVEIEVVSPQSRKRLVKDGFNVFRSVEVVPKLTQAIASRRRSYIRSKKRTLDVIQMSSRGTPLSLRASPTSASFYGLEHESRLSYRARNDQLHKSTRRRCVCIQRLRLSINR
jgi:hypothetical protein